VKDVGPSKRDDELWALLLGLALPLAGLAAWLLYQAVCGGG
jgi:outer membrane biogenesis lipoprotein LolB